MNTQEVPGQAADLKFNFVYFARTHSCYTSRINEQQVEVKRRLLRAYFFLRSRERSAVQFNCARPSRVQRGIDRAANPTKRERTLTCSTNSIDCALMSGLHGADMGRQVEQRAISALASTKGLRKSERTTKATDTCRVCREPLAVPHLRPFYMNREMRSAIRKCESKRITRDVRPIYVSTACVDSCHLKLVSHVRYSEFHSELDPRISC